eukprot:Skav227889  [mRNA]  locus=scaffold3865:66861:67151:- [translate_table: standard]
MLCEAGAAIDHLDHHGYTPLQTAAYYGHAEMTRSLLMCAADVNLRSPLLTHTPRSPLMRISDSGGTVRKHRFTLPVEEATCRWPLSSLNLKPMWGS